MKENPPVLIVYPDNRCLVCQSGSGHLSLSLINSQTAKSVMACVAI